MENEFAQLLDSAKVKVLDHGYVQLVTVWGRDETVVEAARMSTGKGFKGWGPRHAADCHRRDWSDTRSCQCNEAGDEKFVDFLMKNDHMTPFEMLGATFEVAVPLFVAREWHRHRTQSYNEMSGRYTELPNLCYVPTIERLQRSAQNAVNKQGSSDGVPLDYAQFTQTLIRKNYADSRALYETLRKSGISNEIARLVLPVNQYTRFRASANLRNWFQFLKLRLADNAQEEIRMFAGVIAFKLQELFPVSYSAFVKHKVGNYELVK